MSEKSAKEIAFTHEHFVAPLFTERFTHLVDEHLPITAEKSKFLYVESGTGSHALELREKLDDEIEIFGTNSNSEAVKISSRKAAAVKADMIFEPDSPFSLSFKNKEFQIVLCDSTFIAPDKLSENFRELVRVADNKAVVACYLPTAGSYGDVFSIIWETLFNSNLLEYGEKVEKLISQLPTVSDVEAIAAKAGLKNIKTWTNLEVFDYESATEFLESPLITEILMPAWLSDVPAEISQRISDNLAQTIDEVRSGLNFQFTVKATLLIGHKS